MEAAAATAGATTAGPSTEASTPAAPSYDDDSRHYAMPKSTNVLLPPAMHLVSDSSAKGGTAVGTRFHEDCHETDLPSPRLRSSRLYKGKGKDAVPIEKEKKKPLRLLDLPVDILKDIVKEVTHTNDLTSLALCHTLRR